MNKPSVYIETTIIEEIRCHRSEILESFGGDFSKYAKDVRTRERSNGHPVRKLTDVTNQLQVHEAKNVYLPSGDEDLED